MNTTLPQLERDVDRLESLLQRLLDQHTQLLAALQRKRDAMRNGEHDTMAALCRLESECVRAISELGENNGCNSSASSR